MTSTRRLAGSCLLALSLAACGGSAAAPGAPAANSAPASAAAPAKPSANAAASAKPAGSPEAAAKPGTPSPSARPAAASVPAAEKPELAHVRFTVGTTNPSNVPLWLAVETGQFEKYGLTAEIIVAQSTSGITAVTAGDTQFFFGDTVPVFQSVASGSHLSVAGLMRKNNDAVVMARPEIQNANDLKGKAVAISSNGDGTDLAARVALSQLNLQASDVVILPVGSGPPKLAALTTGKAAAAPLYEPTVSEARKQGMHVLVDLTKLPFATLGLAVDRDFSKKNPNTVLATLKALVEGVHVLEDPSRKTETLNVIARNIKQAPDSPQVITGYESYQTDTKDPYPSDETANAVIGGLKSLDPARFSNMTPADVVDQSFASQLRTSGFLKALWGDQLNS
jgi:ABC-type nitrate/sulfonate/bicarbonate transport system substrate-binding protein